MHPALIGTPGHQRIENPVDSDDFAELLNPGHKERKAELYRLAGVRPLSEQQQKQRNDKMRINAAFRWSR
jgi:excisionase family DNA binding protein